MIKSPVLRWFSVIVVGALAVGCGSRSDERTNGSQVQAPAACVTPPGTLEAPVAAAPSPTTAPVASAAPGEAKGAPDAKKGAEKPAVRKVVADAPLQVRRLVVANDIARDRREPVGAGAAFKVDELDKLYAFVEVENPTRSESEVFVTFEPEEGASQGQVSLRVGASPRWRTWAYTRGVKKAGTWSAVVRSLDGRVLAKAPFEVTL